MFEGRERPGVFSWASFSRALLEPLDRGRENGLSLEAPGGVEAPPGFALVTRDADGRARVARVTVPPGGGGEDMTLFNLLATPDGVPVLLTAAAAIADAARIARGSSAHVPLLPLLGAAIVAWAGVAAVAAKNPGVKVALPDRFDALPGLLRPAVELFKGERVVRVTGDTAGGLAVRALEAFSEFGETKVA